MSASVAKACQLICGAAVNVWLLSATVAVANDPVVAAPDRLPNPADATVAIVPAGKDRSLAVERLDIWSLAPIW